MGRAAELSIVTFLACWSHGPLRPIAIGVSAIVLVTVAVRVPRIGLAGAVASGVGLAGLARPDWALVLLAAVAAVTGAALVARASTDRSAIRLAIAGLGLTAAAEQGLDSGAPASRAVFAIAMTLAAVAVASIPRERASSVAPPEP
jgi:hypothetical protein